LTARERRVDKRRWEMYKIKILLFVLNKEED
jgi:hypothetical protein